MERVLLVPIDGSPQSLTAIDQAVEMAEASNGVIELLNVQTAFNTRHAYRIIGKKRLQEHKQECAEKLLSVGERRINQRVEVIITMRQGAIVQEICLEATEKKVKGIVVAARGGKIKGMGVSNVNYKLLKKAPCPVTIVSS